RHEGLTGQRESYARVNATFDYQGRAVRLVIDVGKGAENAKWIKLSGEKRAAGRSPSYKFDFGKGEAIDGTQATVRAAVRRIREGPKRRAATSAQRLRSISFRCSYAATIPSTSWTRKPVTPCSMSSGAAP